MPLTTQKKQKKGKHVIWFIRKEYGPKKNTETKQGWYNLSISLSYGWEMGSWDPSEFSPIGILFIWVLQHNQSPPHKGSVLRFLHLMQ